MENLPITVYIYTKCTDMKLLSIMRGEARGILIKNKTRPKQLYLRLFDHRFAILFLGKFLKRYLRNQHPRGMTIHREHLANHPSHPSKNV